jgi:outer membrane protein insertion porin family
VGTLNSISGLNKTALIFLLFSVCVWLNASYASDQLSNDKACTVRKVEVRGLRSISQSELLYLLDIGKGTVIARHDFSTGVKRAFLLGIFEDIIVESPDAACDEIIVTVKEKTVISSIAIKGNSHFSARFIKKQLHFTTGERLTGLKMIDGIESLKEAMRQRGFAEAEASYVTTRGKGNSVSITVSVSEGHPEIITRIVIPAHADSIRKFLTLSSGGIYDMTEMKNFRNKVLQNYKKKGFVETSLTYAYENGVLTINFEPGRKLIVNFTGNTTIRSSELMKEISFFEINKIDDELVEENVADIVSLYRRNGFISAQVTPVISTAPEAITLDIFISEGDRYKVGKITFEGISIAQDRLLTILASRKGDYYNPDDLETDRENIIDFYNALGYLNVEVQNPETEMEDHNVNVKFIIKENQQVKIASIMISGAKLVSPDEIMKQISLKNGIPYNQADISTAQRKIAEMYTNRGFLEAKVNVTTEISDAAASVTFVVNEGHMTFFGKNIIIGNELTKPVVIEREFTHKMNEPFDYSKIVQERQRLYRLGLFSDVQVVPSDRSDSTRDVIYRLKEADPGAVEFGVGYGEYEKYRASVDLSYRNLFGMDRQGAFRIETSDIEKRVILSYAQPYFFVRDLTFKASLLFENKKALNIDTHEISYHLRREAASAGVEKKLTDTVKGSLNYDFSVVKTKDVQPDIILSREDTGTLIISGVRPELIYDTRDNPFNPKKGVLAGLSLKAASFLLGSETDFVKLQLYANRYQTLSKRLVLAVSLRGGIAEGYRDTTILPLVERFFLGGRTTVRGYDQDTLGPKGADNNPTGGDAFLMGNFEIRTDIGYGFGIVNFVDTGNVWEKVREVDIKQLKFTTGLGLRYNTPIGPLRVDYGIKLNREKGEGFGALHFSIGQAF